MTTFTASKPKTMQTHHGVMWSTAVYADGKKIAEVESDGYGGADNWRWLSEKHKAELLEVGRADTLKAFEKAGMGDTSLEFLGDADLLSATVQRLMGEAQFKYSLKRKLKTHICFQTPAQVAEQVFTFIPMPYAAWMKEKLLEKYGSDIVILNETMGA